MRKSVMSRFWTGLLGMLFVVSGMQAEVPVPAPATPAEVTAGTARYKFASPYAIATSGISSNGITAAGATNIVRAMIATNVAPFVSGTLTNNTTGNAAGATNLWTPKILYTSALGLTNDTSLDTLTSENPSSFGSDQTAAMQSALDQATNGYSRIIVNGRYTVGALRIRGNTHLEMLPDCGLLLMTSNNAPLLRNYNEGTNAIIDTNIVVSGGILNFNGRQQAHTSTNAHASGWPGGFVVGVEFINVQNLQMYDIKMLYNHTFAIFTMRGYRMQFDRLEIDSGTLPRPFNSDGFHIQGPSSDIRINDCTFRTGDDAVAFLANEPLGIEPNFCALYNLGGPISNAVVRNSTLDMCYSMFRALSSGSNITDIVFDGAVGTASDRLVTIENFLEDPTAMAPPSGVCNLGNITLRNINVEVADPDYTRGLMLLANCNATNITIENWTRNTFTNNEYVNVYLWPNRTLGLAISGAYNIDNLTLAGWKFVDRTLSTNVHQIHFDGPASSVIKTLNLRNNSFTSLTNHPHYGPIHFNQGSFSNMIAVGNTAVGYTNVYNYETAGGLYFGSKVIVDAPVVENTGVTAANRFRSDTNSSLATVSFADANNAGSGLYFPNSAGNSVSLAAAGVEQFRANSQNWIISRDANLYWALFGGASDVALKRNSTAGELAIFDGATETAYRDIRLRTATATNLVITTNYLAGNFAVVPGCVKLVASNNCLYAVSSAGGVKLLLTFAP